MRSLNPGLAGLLSGRNQQWLIWTSVLSGLVYLGVSVFAGWQEVAHAFGRVGTAGIAIALLLSLVNYLLRFVRWQYFLRLLGCQIPNKESLVIYLAGFGLTIVPGKAGEVVRSLFLNNRGMSYQLSLAAFLAERLSDMMAVLILTSIGFWAFASARPVIVGLSVMMVLLLLVLRLQGCRARLRAWTMLLVPDRLHGGLAAIGGVLGHVHTCLRGRPLLIGLVLSVGAWAAEAYAFYLVLQWMEAPISLPAAMFIYAFSMLVGAISFLPGGLGGVEATMVGLLILIGLDQPLALAATVIIRLTTLWFAVALGMLALVAMLRIDAESGLSKVS